MVTIEIIKKKDIKVLENLLQLYLHDLSLSFPIEFDSSNGLYKYDSIDKYFDGNNNYAYFICFDDERVGFILIDTNEDKYVVQEIFMINNYKGRGLAKEAITKVFDKYRGNWIIKVVPNSIKAEIFWNRTVSEYTNNNFELIHEGKYDRAVFTFNNLEK